eukprot:2944571-Rhodomonas_salina.2
MPAIILGTGYAISTIDLVHDAPKEYSFLWSTAGAVRAAPPPNNPPSIANYGPKPSTSVRGNHPEPLWSFRDPV